MPKGFIDRLYKIKYQNISIFIIVFLLFVNLHFSFLSSPSLSIETSSNLKNSSSIDFITSLTAPVSENRATTPDWPMFGKDREHSHRANPTIRGIYDPNLKWDKWSQLNGNGIDSRATTIGNFTNNIDWVTGRRNTKHVVYADNGRIFILDGGSGRSVWELNVDLIDGVADNDLVFTTPSLENFDDNSDLDLIFGTTDGRLYCYQPSSSYDSTNGYSWSTDNVNQDKKWSFNTGENFTRASAVLGLLNGDLYPDIVIGAGNKLFAVSGNQGSELWQQRLPGTIISTPVLYKDGSDLNALVTTLNQTGVFNYSASFFNAKSTSGNRLDVKYYDISNFLGIPNQIPSPTVAELDGNVNNDKELIICTPFEGLTGNGKVYVYYTDRSLFWVTPANTITGQIEATPAVADLDNDGNSEIIIISWRLGTLGPITHVYAFHGNNGTLLWHVIKDTVGVPPLYTNERAIASPIVVDVNKDGILDVVFTTSPNIYAIDGKNGTDLWENSLIGTGRELWSTPAAADIDNDGFLDIVTEGAAISHVIIDLTLTEDDLSLSTENVTENQKVTIKAVIKNLGKAEAENIKVSFFENDVLIGNDSVGTIPGEDSREVRIDWIPKYDGQRTIKVIIDPQNTIEEINEKNNEIIKKVDVIASFPDLIIDRIIYYRGDGKQVDNKDLHLIENENSTVKIFVKNIGGDEADNIKVRFLDNGNQIGLIKEIKHLEPFQEGNLTYIWRAVKGNHQLNYQVDFSNIIIEINETNNDHVETVFIKSKVPTESQFISSGQVLLPDNTTPAANIDVTFTNNRTGSKKNVKTNSSGYFNLDIQTLPNKYFEGDEIFIHASDGENESYKNFYIYSEDKERFDKIVLVKLPTYAVSILVDSSSKIVYPNWEVKYNITISNRGNEYNTVNLSLSDVIDVKTNKKADNWNGYLNEYMVKDIPPKQALSGVILTIKAPVKPEDARALDQVLVAITAKSVYDPTQSDIVGVTTTVGRLYNFDISIITPQIELDPLKNTTLHIETKIKNNGNADDVVDITVDNPIDWTVEFKNSLDLDLGEEKSLSIKIGTKDSIPSGEYQFGVTVVSVDGKGSTTEHFKLRVIRPDLKFLGNISMSPHNPVLGQLITFTAEVLNNGSSNIAGFFIEFRVEGGSMDIKSILNLSAGDSERVTFTWSANNAGNYQIEFIIDPYDDILEQDKENNKISFILSFNQDVAILKEPIFSKNNPEFGDSIEISVTIRNVGNIDITTTFPVDFYDGDPDSGGVLIERYNINEDLDIDKDILVNINWKITKGSQERTIYVIANPDNDLIESDYNNNDVKKSIFILKGAQSPEVNDYSYLFIVIIIILAILIFVFIFLSPTKQPAYKRRRYDSRISYEKRKKPRTRSGIELERTKDVKFIVLDEDDIIDESKEEEDTEDNDIDIDTDEDLNERPRSVQRNVRTQPRRSGRSGGIFGSLFGGGVSKTRSTKQKTSLQQTGRSSKGSTAESRITPKPGRRTHENEETDDEIAEVEIIGVGEVEDLDEFDYDNDNDLNDEEPTRDSRIKGRLSQKQNRTRKESVDKEKDVGWEYSQLIGIR